MSESAVATAPSAAPAPIAINSIGEDGLTPSQRAEMEYRAPRPSIGEMVVFYPDGTGRGKGKPAIVEQFHARVVDLVLMGGLKRQVSVRHVSDPKLLLGAAHRENGSWDYTQTASATMASLSELSKANAALVSRVESLERLLQEVQTKADHTAKVVGNLLPNADEPKGKKSDAKSEAKAEGK